MSADIRAAVLEGIDREQALLRGGIFDGPAIPVAFTAIQALRLLRQMAELHARNHGRGTCVECSETWPCPTIVSAARVYAPDALKEKPDAD